MCFSYYPFYELLKLYKTSFNKIFIKKFIGSAIVHNIVKQASCLTKKKQNKHFVTIAFATGNVIIAAAVAVAYTPSVASPSM